MGRRNHKSIVCYLSVMVGTGLFCLLGNGCSDNPEAEAAKQMRQQTAEVVELSVAKDVDAAYDKVMALLQRNRSGGLTKDAALLTSGKLALTKGQNLQAELTPKRLQLRSNFVVLQDVLRDSERLLIEKERVEMLLAGEDQELAELRTLLTGDGQTEGVSAKLEKVSQHREQLLSEKVSLEAERDQVQSVIDAHQSNADALLRQAELAKGDVRLDLERQAFDILQQRKEHYIKVQSLENQIEVLDDEIEFVQVQFDGLTQNVQEIEARLEAVDSAPTRTAMKLQLREVEKTISANQDRLSTIAAGISTALAACRKTSDEACVMYEEAASEFEKISSTDAKFTATVCSADSAHQAALVCSSAVNNHRTFYERLQDLLDTTDPVFVSGIQSRLPSQGTADAKYLKKAMAFFDQSIETYEKALEMVSALSRNLQPEDKSKAQDAKCSLLKSKLLALYSKMQLADLMGSFDVANATEEAMGQVIQRGNELGACFTQSETMRVVANEGLNYLPSIPLNMEVFIEGKKQELSEWKQLAVSEQEAEVDKSLAEIDTLVAEYGQEIATQLEPLKQEMLNAKERGFKETAPVSTDPNSF